MEQKEVIIVQCYWKIGNDDEMLFPIAVVNNKETYLSILDTLIDRRKDCLIMYIKMTMGENYPITKDEIRVIKYSDEKIEIKYKSFKNLLNISYYLSLTPVISYYS